MSENEQPEPETDDSTAAPRHVGERLKAARLAAKLTLEDVASKTRVPTRMLDAIERGAVEELPVGPYATGFARSFARAVHLDEESVTADVRALQFQRSAGTYSATERYEPVDSARIPSRSLVWASLLIFVVLLAGYLVWRSFALSPDTADQPVATAPAERAGDGQAGRAAPATSAPIPDSAPLTARATSEVWFGLNDANGRLVFERTLATGEGYTFTPEQRALKLRTGRPQALQLVLGETTLPTLGAPDTLVKDVALDAASLRARIGNSPATPTSPQTPPASTGRPTGATPTR